MAHGATDPAPPPSSRALHVGVGRQEGMRRGIARQCPASNRAASTSASDTTYCNKCPPRAPWATGSRPEQAVAQPPSTDPHAPNVCQFLTSLHHSDSSNFVQLRSQPMQSRAGLISRQLLSRNQFRPRHITLSRANSPLALRQSRRINHTPRPLLTHANNSATQIHQATLLQILLHSAAPNAHPVELSYDHPLAFTTQLETPL